MTHTDNHENTQIPMNLERIRLCFNHEMFQTPFTAMVSGSFLTKVVVLSDWKSSRENRSPIGNEQPQKTSNCFYICPPALGKCQRTCLKQHFHWRVFLSIIQYNSDVDILPDGHIFVEGFP